MENDSVQSAGGPSLDLSQTLNKPKSTRVYFLAKVLGGIVVALFLIGALNGFPVRQSREAARRTQCINNLKQIGLALHSYHDKHGSFPPAYTVDAQGNRLHSWRTLILPFMDEQKLYESIDLTKPWDHPANAIARQTALPSHVRKCPSARNVNARCTTYLAVSAPNGIFYGSTPRRMGDVRDGSSNTLLIVEVIGEDAVEWMEPKDLAESAFRKQFWCRQSNHTGAIHVLLVDGTVHSLSLDMSSDKIVGLLSIADGEEIGEF